MKRKRILFVYLSLLLFGLYPLEYKEPLCLNVSQYANSANMEVDLEKYRLFIANGDINFLSYPYLSDLLLGTLSKEELRIFRNMFYAAKGEPIF